MLRFIASAKRPPTMAELCAAVGWSSRATASQATQKLAAQGWLEALKGPRGLAVTAKASAFLARLDAQAAARAAEAESHDAEGA